jgi:hypothetical protein
MKAFQRNDAVPELLRESYQFLRFQVSLAQCAVLGREVAQEGDSFVLRERHKWFLTCQRNKK